MSAIQKSSVDEMSLDDLMRLAEPTVARCHGWNRWLEHHHDPAKSALIELLEYHDVVVDDNEEEGQS